jgi:outer membrane protein assembly factor BamB
MPALFIGVKGTVIALDRATGQELWRSDLKGSDFVNVAIEDGDIYATTKGELFCLDPASGHVRWHNELKGMGRGLITIASAASQQAVLMRRKQLQDSQDADSAGDAAIITSLNS